LTSAKCLCGWFVALALLSVLSRERLVERIQERCSFDGLSIDALHRVDRLERGIVQASFCSLRCALSWPERGVAISWQVRDEMSGLPVDAGIACFARSRVITVAAHNERIHCFKSGIDAANHCAQFGGSLIPSPFPALPPAPFHD